MYYEIRVEWDAEAGVWYIEDSNVAGLVGEAATLEAMMALLQVRCRKCWRRTVARGMTTSRCGC